MEMELNCVTCAILIYVLVSARCLVCDYMQTCKY